MHTILHAVKIPLQAPPRNGEISSWRLSGHPVGEVSALFRGEAQLHPFVKYQSDLLQRFVASVVPEEPFLPVEHRVGLVACVVVPLI